MDALSAELAPDLEIDPEGADSEVAAAALESEFVDLLTPGATDDARSADMMPPVQVVWFGAILGFIF